jgi:hypothetical protein
MIKKKSRRIDTYIKPKTIKEEIKFPYRRVRIDWIDIITEGGWGTVTEFKKMKLATPVSEGWLFSKDKETLKYLLVMMWMKMVLLFLRDQCFLLLV